MTDGKGDLQTFYVNAHSSTEAWTKAAIKLSWFETLVSVENVVERTPRW